MKKGKPCVSADGKKQHPIFTSSRWRFSLSHGFKESFCIPGGVSSLISCISKDATRIFLFTDFIPPVLLRDKMVLTAN